MESHAKHGESIYWRRDDTLFLNLFIPSRLDWAERGARIDLDTQFPNGESVEIRVSEAGPRPNFTLAVRLPAWCETPALTLNGRAAAFARRDGYASIRRRWRDGDMLTLGLPMQLRTEAAPDDPRTLSFLSGPLVLAADLGSADVGRAALTPALHEADPLGAATPIAGAPHVYSLVARPAALTLRPFYAQYERHTAPYLRQLGDAEWAERVVGAEETQRRRIALDARTMDMIQLGETESERRHNYRANHADLLSYEGVAGRQAWWGVGNFFEFDLAIEPGPLALHALYWGEEIDKNFEILVDGQSLAHERRPGPPQRAFVEREYALSRALTRGKSRIGVRFETRGSDAPVYQVRIVRSA